MDAALLVVGIVVGLATGLVVAGAIGRSVASSAAHSAARATAEAAAVRLRADAGADREAMVRAAVDTVVAVAGDRLGAQADAGARDLEARQRSFEDRVGEMRGRVADEIALRNAAVEQRMGDVRSELAKVAELVAGLRRERAEQQGRVESRLAEVAAVSARLADTTQSLRQALASPQARGQWGERMADDVLRAAGLVEGINYRKQSRISGAGTIPDFTFMLPGGRVLHMDVKFPIDNYLRFLEAPTDGERDRYRVAFVRDVRARVRELSGRVYIHPDDTLDEVLLFIPNESVYAFVHTHDRDLVEVALRQKVVLCSPSTLFSVLAVIRQAVEQVQLQRTSDEILACLAAFEQQWGKFTDALDKVGRGLDTVRRGWDDLSGTRRRQLERELDRVGDLRSRRELAGDARNACDTTDDASGLMVAGGGEGEVLRRLAGDVRELPRPPDLPGTAAAG
ncbi:MAG: DNA recombination protein RmuC [Acidimicrobiales bacterium]